MKLGQVGSTRPDSQLLDFFGSTTKRAPRRLCSSELRLSEKYNMARVVDGLHEPLLSLTLYLILYINSAYWSSTAVVVFISVEHCTWIGKKFNSIIIIENCVFWKQFFNFHWH